MNDKQLPRVLILASSGVILSASVFGWMESQHSRDNTAAETSKEVLASRSATRTVSTQTQALAQPAAKAVDQGFPATRREEVVAQARASLANRDPMRPLGMSVTKFEPTKHRPVVASTAKFDKFERPPVPPPPPRGYGFSDGNSDSVTRSTIGWSAPAEVKKVEIPLSDQIRLVGLIDNKAIFTVPKSVAADLNLAHPSFTLSQGERVGSVVVESITKTSATVRDGKRISVKELQAIR